MKALSLIQPWASLVAAGAKRWETRSWSTKYRGPLAIHASGKVDRQAVEALRAVCSHHGIGVDWEGMPLGAIIAVADLSSCIEITAGNAPPMPELAFGDYAPGRFKWGLVSIRPLDSPAKCGGALGLWNPPDPAGLRFTAGAVRI